MFFSCLRFTNLFARIWFWPPPPTPEFLTKDFCLQTSFDWHFLLRRTWSGGGGGESCSHCCFQDFRSLSKEHQVSLLRILFSLPETDGNHQMLGSARRGSNRDPDTFGKLDTLWTQGVRGLNSLPKHPEFTMTPILRNPPTFTHWCPTLNDRQITHLICVRLKHLLYDFLGDVLALKIRKQQEGGPNTPQKVREQMF